jgi:hypothetical protein
MITCEHPNDEADGNRWRDLTESVHAKVLGANIRLHKEFERGLELLLCRQVPAGELFGIIQKILENVVRTIESDGLSSPDLLPALVRRAARQLIPLTVPRAEQVNAPPPNAILESILRPLPHNQREALEMVYVGGLDDEAVCARNGLTIQELTALRASVRERFIAFSACPGSAMSAA